jgi:dipeptidyl aminopeptidase/acylaminoacyl peptidase
MGIGTWQTCSVVRNHFLVILVVALMAVPAVAADKRPITSNDLYSFRWLADPQISPDGSQVVYTHVTVNAKHDGYDTALWITQTGGGSPRPLTSGPRDTSPRWSPDGQRIAFSRSAEKDGKPQPGQVFVLPMMGGEARQLTDTAKGAGSFVWSPDGKTIAFSSTTIAKDSEKKPDEEKSDVRVINRAVYRFNGAGYTDFDRPSHIWTVTVPDTITAPQKAVQLTSGAFSEGDIQWSRDASKIYFVSERDREPYYKPSTSELFSVSSKGGEPERVLKLPDAAIRGVSLDPSGTRAAMIAAVNGQPIRSYSQPDLWVASLETGARGQNLTSDYDYDIGGGVGGDQSPPRGAGPSRPVWSRDGKSIYVVASEEGRVNLKRIEASTGKVEPVTTGDHDVYAFSATADGTRFALAISTPTNIGDLFILDVASRKLNRLTNANEKLFSELNVTDPEMIWYKSFDGKRIQTWVQKPPNWEAGKKYPMILDIHGGPHAAYGYTFDHEFQWMAAKGYIVLYPNPRGSTSYGQDFGNVIQYHYPGDDYKDLMAGVDELIKRGWVDPDRMGVTGGSGGGVLTNWTIGQTNRFKAAVSQRSIADWRDFWYTADFALFQATWFRGAPWEQEADFKARSPITYVDKIKTPLMLIEGEADMRTPSGAGGEQMFRALKYRHIPTVMVQFPGETHELSRSGKPKHRVERLEHIVAWFDKYLMGENIRTYDLE